MGQEILTIKEFAFTHLAMNLKGRTDGDRLPSEFIVPTAELRTDLDEFTRLERDALIYHGYSLMKHQIGQHCSALTKVSEESGEAKSFEASHFKWPPPFVELCNPAGGYGERAKAARLKMEKYLRVGQSTLFKDIKRFPWSFAPLLFVFLLIGHAFSNLLVAWKFGGHSVQDIVTEYVCSRIERCFPLLDWLPEWLVNPVNYFVHIKELRQCFEACGFLCGTVEFIITILCIALPFYIALWLYWEVKQQNRWASRCERKMLDGLWKRDKE